MKPDFYFLIVENMNKFVHQKLLLKFQNVLFFNKGTRITGICSLNVRKINVNGTVVEIPP
jgi:hypothetical protein